MKKLLMYLMVGVFGVVMAASAHAETMISSTTVTAYATVTGVSSMTVTYHRVSDDVAVSSMPFGTQSSGGTAYGAKGSQYVRVTVDDNAASWRVRMYTNNFATEPSTTTWGFQYAALISTTASSKASLAWQASTNTVAGGIAVGDPGNSGTTGWTYMKDLSDVDDPSTGATDESWATSDGSGYPNIMYGSPSYTRAVNPAASGQSILCAGTTDPVFVYLEADFSSAAAESDYKATVVVELLNQ